MGGAKGRARHPFRRLHFLHAVTTCAPTSTEESAGASVSRRDRRRRARHGRLRAALSAELMKRRALEPVKSVRVALSDNATKVAKEIWGAGSLASPPPLSLIHI